jgi:hypothetical protein
MRIDGSGGVVTLGYHVAATVGRWSVVADASALPIRFHLDAELLTADAYRVTQSGLGLRLTIGARTLTWRTAALTLTADRVTAVLYDAPTEGAR